MIFQPTSHHKLNNNVEKLTASNYYLYILVMFIGAPIKKKLKIVLQIPNSY